MLQVNISGELESVLNELVLGDETARIEFVKKALAEALENEDERQCAEKAYSHWQRYGGQTYTYEEVMKENGLL